MAGVLVSTQCTLVAGPDSGVGDGALSGIDKSAFLKIEIDRACLVGAFDVNGGCRVGAVPFFCVLRRGHRSAMVLAPSCGLQDGR